MTKRCHHSRGHRYCGHYFGSNSCGYEDLCPLQSRMGLMIKNKNGSYERKWYLYEQGFNIKKLGRGGVKKRGKR